MDKFVIRKPVYKSIISDSPQRIFLTSNSRRKSIVLHTPKKSRPLAEKQYSCITPQSANKLIQLFATHTSEVPSQPASSEDSGVSSNASDSGENKKHDDAASDENVRPFTPIMFSKNDFRNINDFVLNSPSKVINVQQLQYSGNNHAGLESEVPKEGNFERFNIHDNAPRTPKSNVLERIRKDLNSPSALTRVRAMKALSSPYTSAYANYDVPYHEQSLITQDERNEANAAMAAAPTTIQELMKDVVVYVEVRTGEDNRSSGVKQVIMALGASVNDRLVRGTTHVVFKDGLLSTYKKARKWEIPIVSILWIEACKNQRRLCDPKDFPISNMDRYEYPELYEKIKRHRSMQPDSECNRRVRHKATGGTDANTPKTPSKKKVKKANALFEDTPVAGNRTLTEFGYTKRSSTDNTEKQFQINKSRNDTSLIHLVNRAIDNNESVLNMDGVSSSEENIPNTEAGSSFNIKNRIVVSASARKADIHTQSNESFRPKRRSSMTLPSTVTPRRSRRVSTSEVFVSTQDNMLPVLVKKAMSNIQSMQLQETPTITELENHSPKTSPKRRLKHRRSTYTNRTMDITSTEEINDTPSNKKISRRRTLYTPHKIEEETCIVEETSENQSSVMEHNEYTKLSPKAKGRMNNGLDDYLKTPVETIPPIVASEEVNTTPITFDSKRDPRKRRTIFDMSLDVINKNIDMMNKDYKRRSMVSRSSISDNQINLATTPFVQSREETTQTENTVNEKTTQTYNSRHCERPHEILMEKRSEYRNTPTSNKKSQTPLSAQTPNYYFDSNSQQCASTVIESRPDTPTSSTSTPVNGKRKLFAPVDTISPSISFTPSAVIRKRKSFLPQSETKVVASSNCISKTARGRRRSTLDFESVKKRKSIQTDKTEGTDGIEHNSLNCLNKSVVSFPSASTITVKVPKKKLPILVCTNMHREQIDTIRETIKVLGGFELGHSVNKETTHVVSLEPRRTLNLLRALVRGLWIVDYEWIKKSRLKGQWLPEEHFELKKFSRSVEICRAERQAFGNSYKSELFTTLDPFYISTHCGTIPRVSLKELITLCGGKVTDQRKRAKYIIGDSNRTYEDKIYMTPHWILDSITQMQLQKFSKYENMKLNIAHKNPRLMNSVKSQTAMLASI